MATQRSNYDLPGIVEVLRRRKKPAIAFVVITILLGASIILFSPRKYASESRVFLQVGRESVGIDPTATVGQTVALQTSGRAEELQSAIDVLTSRGVASQVVERLGVDVVEGRREGDSNEKPHPLTASIRYAFSRIGAFADWLDPVPPEEKAVVKVERSIDVEAEPESAVLAVTVKAKTPKLAQTILTELIDVYEEEHSRIHRNELSQEFFDEQRIMLRDQLETALQELREAKTDLGIASIEERRINEEWKLREIGLDLVEAEQSLASAQAQAEDLRARLAAIPTRLTTAQTDIPNTGADMLQNQLYQLQIRKLELESRFSPTHPLVQAAAQQVAEAEKVYAKQQSLRQQSVNDMNPLHQELLLQLNLAEAQVEAQGARRDRALGQQKQLVASINELNRQEVRIDQLQRDVELAGSNFSQYAESFEQSRIDNELQAQRISNLSVVQAATLSYKPVSPRRGIVAALTLLVAVFGAVPFALVLDRLDTSLRTRDDVEAELDLPVLGSLPKSDRSPLAVS